MYASFWQKACAIAVDHVIILCAYSFILIPFNGHVGMSPSLIALLFWLIYQSGFIASNLQSTPGGLIFGLRVENSYGENLNILQAIARAFLSILSALIFGFGFFLSAFTENNQALHDLIVRSYVTAEENEGSNLKYFCISSSILALYAMLLILLSSAFGGQQGSLKLGDTIPLISASKPSVENESILEKIFEIEGVKDPKYTLSSKRIKVKSFSEKQVLDRLKRMSLPPNGGENLISDLGTGGIGVYKYGKGVQLKTRNKLFFHFLSYKLLDLNGETFQLLMSRAEDKSISHKYTLAGLAWISIHKHKKMSLNPINSAFPDLLIRGQFAPATMLA